jgi:preprotein translocase subunit SecE
MSNRETEQPKLRARIRSFYMGVKSELKKVNWPSRTDLTNYTIVVLVTVAIMTVVIWGLDIVFENLVGLIV